MSSMSYLRHTIESRLTWFTGLAGLALLFGCGSDSGATRMDAAADAATVAYDGHSPGPEVALDAVTFADAAQAADVGEQDAGVRLDVDDRGDRYDASTEADAASRYDAGTAPDAAGAYDGGGDAGQDMAADRLVDADPLTAPDAEPFEDDLVFDGLDEDGVRRILLWRAGAQTAIRFGAGYEGSNPSPRPDGKALLLQSLATDEDPSGLMLVDDLSRPARFFAERSVGSEREPAWSPDGRHVAFIAHALDPSGDVWVAEVVGEHLANTRNLTPCSICLPGREAETTPSWSPDGALIAFTSYAGVSPSIWVMNADGSGGHPVTVTDGQAADYFPDWSPDGRFIAFQRNSAGPARIGIVSLADGSTRFFDLPGPSYTPAWSSDGRKIALTVRRPDADTDIVIIDTEGVELARLVRPGDDRHPAWIPRSAPRDGGAP